MCHLFEVFSADIIEMLRIDLILLVIVMSYGFFLLWFVAHEPHAYRACVKVNFIFQ